MSEYIKIGDVGKLFTIVKEVQPLQKAMISEPTKEYNKGYKIIIGVFLLGVTCYEIHAYLERKRKKQIT
jgi:hypothetical protein